jgi:hypothetical protein
MTNVNWLNACWCLANIKQSIGLFYDKKVAKYLQLGRIYYENECLNLIVIWNDLVHLVHSLDRKREIKIKVMRRCFGMC